MSSRLLALAPALAVVALCAARGGYAAGETANGNLVVAAQVGGQWDLYAGAPGHVATQLTNDAAVDVAPAWSHDGRQIAFVRHGSLAVVDADGGGLHTVLPASAQSGIAWPAWSPDGSKIAFQGSVGTLVAPFVVGSDGTGLLQLAPASRYGRPTWSPDGTRIAFDSGSDFQVSIWTVAPDGSNLTLLRQGNPFLGQPAWSPDGTTIAVGLSSPSGIALIAADGTGPLRTVPLANLPNVDGFDGVSWSPDGTKLLFGAFDVVNSAFVQHLYTVNLDGSHLRTATLQRPVVDPSSNPPDTLSTIGGGFDWQPVAPTTDPGTFGVSTPGSSSDSPGAAITFGSDFTLVQPGVLGTFRFYAAGGANTQSFVPVVYAVDDRGNPTTLVAKGAAVTVQAGQAPGWVSSQLPPLPVASADYFLGLLSGPAGGGARIFYERVSDGGIYNGNPGYPDPSSPFGAVNRGNQQLSIQVTTSPVATTPPTIDGTPALGQLLTAGPGTLGGGPDYAYTWRRCDAAGAQCIDEDSGPTHRVTLLDVAKTLRVLVTPDTHAVPAALSPPTARVPSPSSPSPPAPFDAVVSDAAGGDCDDCSFVQTADRSFGIGPVFQATVGAGVDSRDTAYGSATIGGTAGANGTVTVSDALMILPTTAPSASVSVVQVRDVAGQLVWELYVSPDRVLHLWSPAGGLDALPLNLSTGVAVPVTSDPAQALKVVVAAQANDSLAITVNGTQTNALGGLAGATTLNQGTVRIGIDHYDSTSSFDTLAVAHSGPSWTSSGTPTAAPASTAPPRILGTPAFEQPLTVDPGAWTGSPTLAYTWYRCDETGASCVAASGTTSADGTVFTPSAAEIAKTIVVDVRAANAAGTVHQQTAPSARIPRPPLAPPAGFDSIVSDPGCDDCTITTAGDGFQATVGAGVDDLDTAYALADFGGAAGAPGHVAVTASLALAPIGDPTANVSVLQVRDTADRLVWELYADSSRRLHLWSPAGGLGADAINLQITSGPLSPTDVVQVSALADDSVAVAVDGTQTAGLTGLHGAATSGQRYLRAGIDHYDSPSAYETYGVVYRGVGVTAG